MQSNQSKLNVLQSGMIAQTLTFLLILVLTGGCQEDPLEFQPTGLMKKGDVVCCEGDKDLNQQFYKELNELKAAVAPLKVLENAKAAGYTIDVTGYVPQMGHHFLNPALMDNTFDHRKPELLLFVPGENGKWDFIAVEYAVPIADMNNIPPPPEGFTGDADEWVVNYGAELWTLHVWIELENPNGLFEPRNPNVP